MSYCKGLKLAGYDEWRLPSVNELSYIIVRHDILNGYRIKMDTSLFPNAKDTMYWSYTPAKTSGYYWFVDFGLGRDGVTKGWPCYVRDYK